MNLLIDMNLPAGWADFLTGAGHVSVEWGDAGVPTASDHDVLAWAAEHGYELLTADFEAAGAATGVIVLPCGDLTPDVQGHAVLTAIHQRGADLGSGVVVDIARA